MSKRNGIDWLQLIVAVFLGLAMYRFVPPMINGLLDDAKATMCAEGSLREDLCEQT